MITCTSQDSLASLLLLIKQRRVHRLVVVEGDLESKRRDRSTARDESTERSPPAANNKSQKGRLVGIITLSDVLRYLVGHRESSIISGGIGESWDEDYDPDAGENGSIGAIGSFGMRGETRGRSGMLSDPSGFSASASGSGVVTPQTAITTPSLPTPSEETPPA